MEGPQGFPLLFLQSGGSPISCKASKEGSCRSWGTHRRGGCPPLPAGRQPNPAWPPAQHGGEGPPSTAVFPQGRDTRDEGQGVCSRPGNPDCARRLEHPDPSPTPAAFKASAKRPHSRLSRVEPRPAACSLIPRHPEEQEEGEQEAMRKKGSFLLEGQPQSSLERSAVRGGRTWAGGPGRGTSVSTGP